MKFLKRIVLVALLGGTQVSALAAGVSVQLYKNPNCGCCDIYAEHLEANGFEVHMINTNDMAEVKQKFGVPEQLEGCHTATAKGYVLEGLVPAEHIKRLLSERRPIKGLAVPGMPVGAPGMPGIKKGPIHVYVIGASKTSSIYASF